MRNLKKAFMREDSMLLGEKRVKIEKLTPKKWKELFGVIDMLPSLIVNVVQAPQDQFMAYALTAAEVGMDELMEVTSILTGIEKEYLEDEVGLDEIVEYVTKMIEFNSLERMVKNLQSLLPKPKEETTETE